MARDAQGYADGRRAHQDLGAMARARNPTTVK